MSLCIEIDSCIISTKYLNVYGEIPLFFKNNQNTYFSIMGYLLNFVAVQIM